MGQGGGLNSPMLTRRTQTQTEQFLVPEEQANTERPGINQEERLIDELKQLHSEKRHEIYQKMMESEKYILTDLQ